MHSPVLPMLLLMILMLRSAPCLPHPEATPCLYFYSNHILLPGFQDFSRHDAPMHRCSRAPELTSRATDRATHHQSQGSTARQSPSHQFLRPKVQYGTARRGTVLPCARCSALRVLTMALMRSLRRESFRATGPHLGTCGLHMLRDPAHPSPLGPLPTHRTRCSASSLAPSSWPPEPF